MMALQALGMNMTNDELAKLDRKMMSTIYSDGERFVEIFKRKNDGQPVPLRLRSRIFRSI